MRVIADKGPEAASIADFAALANVSRGVFYNYFPSQDDLVLAVWETVWRDIDREIVEVTAGIDDPAEQIACACVKFIDECLRNPVRGWVWLRLDATPALPSPEMAHHFRIFHDRGMASGRFRTCDRNSAVGLTAGAMRMAVRMALTGVTPRDAAYETVGLILASLGVDHDEARRLAFPDARQD